MENNRDTKAITIGNGNNKKINGKCKFITVKGSQCKATPLRNEDYCYFHSEQVREVRGKIELDKGLTHIKKYLARLILDVRRGKVEATNANAIANLCDKLVKCIEKEEIIDQIKEIRERVNSRTPIQAHPDADCVVDLELPEKLDS